MPSLSVHDRRRLALEAFASDRTVKRVYQAPGSAREATLLRISAAARRLGLPIPPDSANAGRK